MATLKRIVQNNSAFDAYAKLLNFTKNLKTEGGMLYEHDHVVISTVYRTV